MRAAAANEGGMGAAMGYMGMNMANQAGAGLLRNWQPRQASPGTFAKACAVCPGTWQLDLFLRSGWQYGELLHGLRTA